jgi:stearoyl-CoA desaturase (delta-9 desaturase)
MLSRGESALIQADSSAVGSQGDGDWAEEASRANVAVSELPPPGTIGNQVTMVVAVLMPLVGCVVAMVWLWQHGWMGWLYVGLLVGGWVLTGLGITIGFHRLLTHRSFETYGWLRALWMLAGALSVEGSPLVWCAIHRRHHQRSDKPGDPHSPHLHGGGFWNTVRGLWHSHTGWLFSGYWSFPDLKRYVPDLLADRLLVAVDRVYYVWVLLSLAVPAALGGLCTLSWTGALLGLIWGGLVRILLTHHITWSINSICHVIGRRHFQSGDHSRNNLICGILGFGEGWHNNHHAFPVSARHGLLWWQFDASWLIIRTMQLIGLAWNVRLPEARMLEAKRLGG